MRRYRLPLASLRKWEQGQRRPDAAARAYLTLIERDPNGVAAALAPPPPGTRLSDFAALLALTSRWRGKATGARR